MKSQKFLKEQIIKSRKQIEELSIKIKEVSKIFEESTTELQKVCKHKNYTSKAYMRSRRMDYLDWEEPAISYICLDCGKEY